MPSAIEVLSPGLLPGESPSCEFCGQRPESIAFDLGECQDRCPIKRVLQSAVAANDPVVAPSGA
jgi:hypothetical protein